VPANVPLHMQLIDKFAMSVATEDIWISGRPGEQRFCGGCHEDRARNTLISPGNTEAGIKGPINLDSPRSTRLSTDYSYEKIRGVPWNLAIQPIFDAKCVSCHDGDPTKPGNRSYTVTDATAGTMQTFTFDLRGHTVALMVGERNGEYDFPASYISLLGLEMEFGENDVTIAVAGGGTMPSYVTPGSAKGSLLVKKLNPPQRFKALNTAVRAFPGASHPADVGGTELTADEYYRIILNIDMGAQFFFRENKSGARAPTGGTTPPAPGTPPYPMP
jgi:Hydrazine synthase alpha subunit middle domain